MELEKISVIDGYLVGGCSIKKEDFKELIEKYDLRMFGDKSKREGLLKEAGVEIEKYEGELANETNGIRS